MGAVGAPLFTVAAIADVEGASVLIVNVSMTGPLPAAIVTLGGANVQET